MCVHEHRGETVDREENQLRFVTSLYRGHLLAQMVSAAYEAQDMMKLLLQGKWCRCFGC